MNHENQESKLCNQSLSKDMSLEELSNWMALCNALKFINNTSELTGKYVDEKDLNYREMLNYITSAGGDIKTCLLETKGIPLKYSLDVNLEESFDIDEVNYDFLDK